MHDDQPPGRRLQPLLHDLVTVVRAPAMVLSAADGQLRGVGAHGLFQGDYRMLSHAVLLIDGREAEPIAHTLAGPAAARFTSLIRWAGDAGADPTLRLDRVRRLGPEGMTEEVRISSTARTAVTFTVTVDLGCDFAPIEEVKAGGDAAPHLAHLEAGRLAWRQGVLSVVVTAPGADLEPDLDARLAWEVTVPPGGRADLRWTVAVTDPRAVLVTPPAAPEWTRPEIRTDDRRLTRLLTHSLDDLEGLRLAEASAPADTFLGAGAPWYLTLFGRDSLWAARMLLPLGTGLAVGTLRALARRQGTALDARSGEAPGKIMHELRRHEFHVSADGADFYLPPAYYGTVDATLLWICLLHDAWRWGLPDDDVRTLLPALQAALVWLDEYADPDRDGFVEYLDTSGLGLANQGWKDSGDAVRFRDGRLAEAPIALVEVQGYAHEAAVGAAALLEAFGLPGADKWRVYAKDLAKRFRAAFWVDGPHGRYPALALDRAKRPVDALTSNIGHLLGTGILTPEESAQIAALLQTPELSDGFGLRTMSRTDGGFNPLSYHCGSVWAHDTAIAISGLAAEGHLAAAHVLAEGLLEAADDFDYRLPELHGGEPRAEAGRPTPYPAACRPQAWSAASAVAIAYALGHLRS